MQKNPRTSLIKVPNWGKSNFCGSEFDLWLWLKSQFYYKKLASNGLKMRFLSWAWHFRICFGLVILSRNEFEIFLKRQFTIATRIFCHFYPNFYLNPIYRRTRFLHFLILHLCTVLISFCFSDPPLLQNVSQISKKKRQWMLHADDLNFISSHQTNLTTVVTHLWVSATP